MTYQEYDLTYLEGEVEKGMLTEYKAIETRYAGCRFRSRLEARWACFFDACGVKWLYEVQGYDFSDVEDIQGEPLRKYLPDFWLPEHSVWIEIKPTVPEDCFGFTESECLMYELVRHTKADEGWIFFGLPSLETRSSCLTWMHSKDRKCFVEWPKRYLILGVYSLPFNVEKEYCDAATSARFEHGESGAG